MYKHWLEVWEVYNCNFDRNMRTQSHKSCRALNKAKMKREWKKVGALNIRLCTVGTQHNIMAKNIDKLLLLIMNRTNYSVWPLNKCYYQLIIDEINLKINKYIYL